MPADEPTDMLATDPTLAALARGGRAAFAVGQDGEVVWSEARAERLLGTRGLDASAKSMLARMAGSAAGGMVRLRLGDPQTISLAFQARPISVHGAPRLLALECLTPIADADLPAETEPAAHMRDVAREEGAGDDRQAAETAPSASELAPVSQFVFEIDREDRIAFLSPDLARMVGETATNVQGRAWSEVADELDLDPEGRVAQALARRGGWSDIVIAWPLADGRRQPIALSALPMFDRGRTFVGFRGLGRLAGEPAGAPEAPLAAETELEAPCETTDASRLDGAAKVSDLSRGDHAVIEPPSERGADRPSGDNAALTALRALFADAFPSRTGKSFDGAETTLASDEQPASTVDEPDADAALTDVSAAAEAAIGDTDDAPEEPAAVVAEQTPEEDVRAETRPMDAPAQPIEDSADAPQAERLATNVVPLRDGPPNIAALTSSEENAFDEIARRLRALGVRISDDPAALDVRTEDVPSPVALIDSWTIDDVDAPAPAVSLSDDLNRLVDRLPVGALVLRAGEIVFANRATLDMLGHPHLADLQERGAEALFAEPLPHDDAAPSTIVLIARDGVEIEVEARLSAIGWGGAPSTLVSLRRAEGSIAAARAAIEREREIAEILEAATDGVMVLDGAGRILSVSRGAEDLFGFQDRDVVGSLFTLSLAPESRRAAFEYLDHLKAGGAGANGAGAVALDGCEVLGLARLGGAIPLFLTIARVGSAEANRFCAVLRDITPWKRAEEELLAAKRQAERANAQKTDFLAKVSHEIRTPLNAIIGFADVMMEERFGPIGSPRYKDYLRDIHASGGHLVGLVNDLLDITRIESGGLKLDPSPIDLNEIAQQAAALLQPQANRDHVIIRTSLARGLPQVLADRRSVRQIMTNLAANAVRLSRPGGQVIVATALTDVGQAVIRVRDAGVGMSKQELARALEPFRPLGLADNDSGGHLGLPLTKALAEANDAGFALKSELGHGTLAEVTFPASRVLVS